SALRAVMAWWPAVVWLGNDRHARRNAGDVQLVAGLLDDGLCAARLRRRHENPVRSAGNIFFGAEDADVGLNFVVVGSDVLISKRPVVAHAIGGARLEIYRRKAECDP